MIALIMTQVVSSDSDSIACGATRSDTSAGFVYRLRARLEPVSAKTRKETIEVMCKRLRGLKIANAYVGVSASDRIRLALPDPFGVETQRVIERVGTTGQLFFYDWEANLIGPERVIGGHPGQQPPQAAIRKANAEWKAAGRNTSDGEDQQLILSGALPTAYDAVLLASRQEPVEDCSNCSTTKPRYYLFDSKEPHSLIAGPEFSREDLYFTPTGRKRSHKGVVLRVPVGTVVVSEQPLDSSGEVIEDPGKAGWYALRDRPALSGADITRPRQEYDELGQPNLTFGFTDSGRKAFQEATRRIAQRGQVQAIGPVSGEQAEQLSNRFAIVFDNEVKTRPIINFAENPDGIDGRTGAQISGGFTSITEAQDLATLLRIGPLPLHLVLIGHDPVVD